MSTRNDPSTAHPIALAADRGQPRLTLPRLPGDAPAAADAHAGATADYTIDRRFPTGADHRPFSVILDGEDLLALLIGDEDELVIRRFGPDGAQRESLPPIRCGDRPGQIGNPAGIALDAARNLYLLDSEHCRVLKLDRCGRLLATFGGVMGIRPGGLAAPRDLEVAPDGAMLLADTGNHRIQRWDHDGHHTLTIGPTIDDDEDDEIPPGAGPGQFCDPMGVTEDNVGRIYVADTGNHRVQIFERTGRFLRAFGDGGEGRGQLHFPTDVRVGADGTIFVFDLHSRRVQRFTADGGLIYGVVLRGEGTDRIVGAVGDIDVGADESLYVPAPAERQILRIRRVET